MSENKVDLIFHMINDEIVVVKNAIKRLLFEEMKDDRSKEIILPNSIILKDKIVYIDIKNSKGENE